MSVADQQTIAVLAVFAMAGCRPIPMGQRLRWSVSDTVLREFNPDEWEAITYRDPTNNATIFELIERRGGFGMTRREMDALTEKGRALVSEHAGASVPGTDR